MLTTEKEVVVLPNGERVVHTTTYFTVTYTRG